MATVKYLDENGLSTVWSKVKGIVTPKADKVSGATAGHLAGLNSGGNLVDSGLAADNIAQKDGSYSGMTVGAAEDLVSAESVASEFTSRITGGSTAVGKGGTALVDKIKGRTLVWNQLVQNGNFPSMDGWAVATSNTASVSGNKLTITCGSAENNNNCAQQYISILGQHYYYLSFYVKVTSSLTFTESFIGYFGAPTQWLGRASYNDLIAGTRVSLIARAEGDHARLHVGVYGQYLPVSSTVEISDVKLIDLTLMFGAGSEPSTAAEFDALYPLPYYDYNPGKLISNAATAIETVGFNQWDEEWEGGSINDSDGQPATNSSYIRSKNFIPAFPSTEYYKTTNARIFFYDAGKNYLGYTPTNAAGSFTTPAGTRYLKIRINYASPYQNDICISLADPSRNGTYEPHWRSELELGLGDIKVKSHNIWDEVWEEGTIDIDTGQNITGTAIRSVNYIPVSPGGTYYHKGTAGILEYDAQKNYIGRQSQLTDVEFTVSNNCSYIRIISAGVTTYSNNICINLSDPAFNGRYEPYGDGGVLTIQGGPKSVFTVYDEISGGKFINRVGSVTLDGTTEVVAGAYTPDGSSVTRFGYAGAQNTSIYKAQTGYVSDKFVFVIGSSGGAYNVTNTNTTGANRLFIWLPSSVASTDAAANTWLASNPSTFYYELASPIEYELAEAIPTAMRNDPYGTERRLPEDTAAIVTAPFRADITYSTNIKEAVQSLPQNYINVNSMQDFLAELGTLMGGTWTMRPADGKFDFSFTPNPSNE